MYIYFVMFQFILKYNSNKQISFTVGQIIKNRTDNALFSLLFLQIPFSNWCNCKTSKQTTTLCLLPPSPKKQQLTQLYNLRATIKHYSSLGKSLVVWAEEPRKVDDSFCSIYVLSVYVSRSYPPTLKPLGLVVFHYVALPDYVREVRVSDKNQNL